MNKFKSPLSDEEICTAVLRTLNKINGVYYSKHRSWRNFVKDADNDSIDDKETAETALLRLPLCVAHDSRVRFPNTYSFYENLCLNGETHSTDGKMALRRLAELYVDLASNSWPTSNVLTKSLEQFFSYNYEPAFGSLLCCALMSGWYGEVFNIIIPRIKLLGEAKIGDFYIYTKKDETSPPVQQYPRRFRVLEFIAHWFDECAVNMLKGVSARDPFNYYVFECAEDQRLFFTNEVDNVKKVGGNNVRVGRRYAFLAALLYQLDYIMSSNEFEDDNIAIFNFFWRTANCYANSSHMKESVYFAERAEEILGKAEVSEWLGKNKYKISKKKPFSNYLAFCGDMMNIYYFGEQYDKMVKTRKMIMPNGDIGECDEYFNKCNKCFDGCDEELASKLLYEGRNSVKRKIVIQSASRHRFTTGIKKYKQGFLPDEDGQKAAFDDICTKTWAQFSEALEDEDSERVIALLFARTIFFNDTKKQHFYRSDTSNQSANEIIEKANLIDKNFSKSDEIKQKGVWLFFKAMILLKYAVSVSVPLDENYKTSDDEQKEYLKAAWEALKNISSSEKFLMRSKFAIEKLRELDDLGDKTPIYDSLLFMYMTFRIQDILSVSINEIKEMDNLCSYTTMSNLYKWLESSTYKGCPLLMMNVNYFNDPEEGRIIPNLMNGVDKNYTPSKVFVRSFTQNSDNLPMWDRYADNGNGVCVRLDPSSFGRSAENLLTSDESEIIAARVEDSNSIYRVAYCSQRKYDQQDQPFGIDAVTMLGNEETGDKSYKHICEEVEKLVGEMKKARDRIHANTAPTKPSDNDGDRHWRDFKKILDYYAERVSYLFKGEAHKSEQELRIISYDYDNAKELAAEPFPRIAAAWNNAVTFKEIMFGPRVSDAMIDLCTPYIQRKIERINRWKTQQNDVKLSHSDIKAR